MTKAVQSPALPVTRREKIVYLLDQWDEIFSPPVGSGVGRGDGSDTPHLSPMSRHVSVVELARCLGVLRSEAPSQFGHLMTFHRAEWRVRRWSEPKRRRGGRVEHVDRVERQRIVPGWVRLEKVRRGQDRLAELFRGEVFIPGPLWDALTKSSEEIELKQRRRGSRAAA